MEAAMGKTLQWVIGLGLVLIVAAVVVAAVWMLGAHWLGWSSGYSLMSAGQSHMPMMGQTGTYGMMGGFGMPFMGLGMLLGPLVLVGPSVLGVVWLMRKVKAASSPHPPLVPATCAHCGKPVEAGWIVCPRCGEKI
jgi:hypothetical protein